MLKKIVKFSLFKIGLYPSIKYSILYDVYCYLFLSEYWLGTQKQIAFYKKILGHSNLIFDVGANGGSKTNIYLKVSKKVLCIEPDKSCVDILNSRFKNKNNVTVVPVGISDLEGKEIFYIEGKGSCLNTFSSKWRDTLEQEKPFWYQEGESVSFTENYEVEVTTLDRLIKAYGIPDYIKLDIEGYEKNALKGLSYPVKFISLEANLPALLDETIECINIINNLSPDAKFAYSLEEGFVDGLSSYLTSSQLIDFINQTEYKFLEVLAILS
jgi:FkbM family methyltransferase